MFGVLIPVGPDPRDAARLQRLTEELARHESVDEMRLAVVDDHPEPRTLRAALPLDVTVRTPLWTRRPPDVLSAHVAGTLTGLRALADTEFVVKLDTDAAVIGPFSERLRRAFAAEPTGVVGSYDRSWDGGVRDWSRWRRLIDRAADPVGIMRVRGRVVATWRPRAQRAAVRGLRARAYAFAAPGAHCLGGAYAVSAAFLQHAALDWRPWIRTHLGEDVVVGVLSAAAGLPMRSLTAAGEPFAVSWRGLPAPPERLRARGHGIVHSIKCADERDERALCDALQAPLARPPGAAGGRAAVPGD